MNKLEKNQNYTNETFEEIKHIDENGVEFWYARELQSVLSYKEWRTFESVINKAKVSCKNSGINAIDHFVEANKMIEIAKGAKRNVIDYKLTRYACYLIAQNEDSRAYIVKNEKLIQLSREDTITQKYFINGKLPDKEASRFDQKSNILVQSIGMNRDELEEPYTCLIENSKYDLLLLFSDGVTDCLSDDDIVAVCKKSNRSEIAKKIVKKAIKHDSIVPEKYINYDELNTYIPGGKDNATAAVYVPKKNGDDLTK